jgi:hypothetical protein
LLLALGACGHPGRCDQANAAKRAKVSAKMRFAILMAPARPMAAQN